MNLKIVASTVEEFKELQKGLVYFSGNFVLNSDAKELWVESGKNSARNLEGKFENFILDKVKSISIYTKKEGIKGIFNTGEDIYDVFWFNSEEDKFLIGLKTKKEEKDYLFEVKYKPQSK